MTEISIKTGTLEDAQSDCAVEMEICGVKGICCQTSHLNNVPEDDRENGQTDVYTNQTILGSCAKEVRMFFFFSFYKGISHCSLREDFWAMLKLPS